MYRPNRATAIYFEKLCVGQYSGQMARVPYNPEIRALIIAHDADDRTGFIEFLRRVADQLDKTESY